MDEQLICRAVEQAVREAGMAVMTLEKAKRLIDKVEKKAEEMGVHCRQWRIRLPGQWPFIVWTMRT